jgi:hypothetical protein
MFWQNAANLPANVHLRLKPPPPPSTIPLHCEAALSAAASSLVRFWQAPLDFKALQAASKHMHLCARHQTLAPH